ncbi:cell division protein FtsX [Solitalea canadensis]|uniref:Cell division protein FtsX n=1 Tax=Solitalea canadensis (strain ATCC 29591 / DSM 3403 / JCM 21819 / LMG 8368 / NBRC 15130 / NCIMB 12057 / USAM 9D) TaxID=929556 RepID=H8KNH3_SOLCM|nr:permease-like cell division protein FtsX [Solitalea canadensis]AFD07971.1 cell division protein [Solitalea canadensis DSM 3403]
MQEFEESNVSKRTKRVYITTVISIAMVLLMVGLAGLLILHVRKISDYVKENIVVNVYLNEDAKEVDILALQKEIEKNPAVKSTVYVSKELAAENLSKDLGEDFIKFLGYNPLLYSIDVYMKADFADNASIDKVTKEITGKPIVKEVKYQPSLVDSMNRNMKAISLVILCFGGLLLFIALALINNTIRLAIYSQRFLIKSMQLVGATKNFIRKPFLTMAILHGILAGLLATLMVMGVLYLARNEIPELIVMQDYAEFGILFAGLIILGILISLFSTYFAVTRYLRLKIDALYV